MRPRRPWHRSGRGWYVEVGGRQHLLVTGPKNDQTRDQAERRYYELMLEIRDNPPVDGGNPTVAAVIEAYLETASKQLSPNTYYEVRLYLQKFADVHGGRLVSQAKAYHVTAWLDSHPTWQSEWTRSFAVRTVKRPFNWAVKQGLIPANPFTNVEHRAGDRRRPMTDAEFDALLAAADPASGLIEVLRFAALTGCRPCEIRALRWDEVHLDRGVAIMTQHKTSRTQRDRKPRVVVLIPEIVQMLTTMAVRDIKSEYVFLNRRGEQWCRCSIQQVVRRLRRQLKLPEDVSIYGLRHRFGTLTIKNGVDLKTAAVLMGHETSRMTEHYVHLAADYDHLAQAMRRATRSAGGV